MSQIWKARLSYEYNKRDYKSLLFEYSGDEIKKMLEDGVTHIHIVENGKEIERPILDEEKVLLCSVMYSTLLSIKYCNIETDAAISAGEYTADCLFADVLHTELQGYLSFYNPMWEFLDYLALIGKDFEIKDGVLVQYHGREKHVTIPDGVTNIGREAFMWNIWIQSVTIPDGVTEIDKAAFKGCTNLKSVSIPKSVTTIGVGAFEFCKNLTTITIPEGVTSISNCAFSDCVSLESVSIPESVMEIGFYAFGWCKSLVSVTIPEGVTEIGDDAFYGCPFQP